MLPPSLIKATCVPSGEVGLPAVKAALVTADARGAGELPGGPCGENCQVPAASDGDSKPQSAQERLDVVAVWLPVLIAVIAGGLT